MSRVGSDLTTQEGFPDNDGYEIVAKRSVNYLTLELD